MVKDKEHCIECGLCFDICGPQAILHEDAEKEFVIEAASIVVSTGYEVFDARKKSPLGLLAIPRCGYQPRTRADDQCERPDRRKIRRLSDGKEPEALSLSSAWVHGIYPSPGLYCSCVCCMQAIKNAMLIREKHPEIEVTIFYMDVRSYGKGYEEYYERAKGVGVRFVRGMPWDVLADKNSSSLRFQVQTTRPGEAQILHPGLVVLRWASATDATAALPENSASTGRGPGLQSVHDAMDTVGTMRPGIYVAATAIAPKDIPDSVASGESAAMRAFIDTKKTTVARARSR